MKSNLISLAILLAFSFSVKADDKKEADLKVQAIKQTQELLNDPAKVKDVADKDPAAKAVDNHVKELAGSDANVREMYSISADVLPVLMEMNQDNPEKALESLSAYSKDPAAFLKSLPLNLRERIEKLGKKVEAEKGKKNKP
jgi:hypothetical protein